MPEDMLARLLDPGVMHDRAAPSMQCEVRQHSPRSVSQPGPPVCQLVSCLPVLSSVVLSSKQVSELAAPDVDEAFQARLPRASGELVRADGGHRAQQGLCCDS